MEASCQLHTAELYSEGKSPWHPLDRRLGGTQSRSGHGGEEKFPSPCRDSNPRQDIKVGLTETGCEIGDLSELRIGSNGGVLWTQKWTFVFHKSGEFLDQMNKQAHQLCAVSLAPMTTSWTYVISTRRGTRYRGITGTRHYGKVVPVLKPPAPGNGPQHRAIFPLTCTHASYSTVTGLQNMRFARRYKNTTLCSPHFKNIQNV
jgi:hypothetical protein